MFRVLQFNLYFVINWCQNATIVEYSTIIMKVKNQCCGSGFPGFWWPKILKKIQFKIFFFFWCNLLFPRPSVVDSKLLRTFRIRAICDAKWFWSKTTLKNWKFYNFKNHSWSITMPRPSQSTSKLQEKALALQKIKFINFSLFLWVIFALQDPDPD